MNRREAFEAAVMGDKVRAADMPEGVYIDYNFNGWRINFHSGSSSGYTSREHDETVDWEVYVKPEPVGWDMSMVQTRPFTDKEIADTVKAVKRIAINSEFGKFSKSSRRGRKAWVPPAEINDIDDTKPEIGWDEVFADKAKVEGGWADKPKPINPWFEAGLTSEEKPASGWADYGKGNAK